MFYQQLEGEQSLHMGVDGVSPFKLRWVKKRQIAALALKKHTQCCKQQVGHASSDWHFRLTHGQKQWRTSNPLD